MAIRLKFDDMNNVQTPTLVLATRSGNKLGCVPAYNLVFKGCLNIPSAEMSFRVNKVEDGVEHPLWSQIKDFKLIWVKEWDVWFEIYVEIDEQNEIVKTVTAKSLGEAELSQINLYGMEVNTEDDIARDDYEPTVFYDEMHPEVSLLNRLFYKAPHYKIGHVDLSLYALQRTFAFDGESIIDAFQTISEELNCLFVIDSGSDAEGKIARTINVYDLESYCLDCDERGNFFESCSACGSTNIQRGYGEDTNIFVSTDNLSENIVYATDVGSVKNCFKLEAGDDLMTATIINCNPNGSAYIWHISDDTKEDMSDELVKKLEDYDKEYEHYQKENITNLSGELLSDYNDLVSKYLKYSNDIAYVDESLIGYSALMNAYYDTIDFNLFLNHRLMPEVPSTATTAKEQISLLNSNNLSPVSLTSLSSASVSTATNAVISMARTVLNSRYQVKASNTRLDGNTWSGVFTVTNYSNEMDTATGSRVSVTIDDSYQGYVQQRIDRTIGQDSDGVVGIVELFKMSNSNFSNELKKYCLSQLKSFKTCCQSCLNILIEQGVASRDSELYDELYSSYHSKSGLIENEIASREAEIAIISGSYDSRGKLVKQGLQNLIEDAMINIQETLDFEKYLGENLWLEFCAYRREDTYRNDNYISDGLDNAQLFQNALEFIKIAKKEIFKSATLQHSISASLRNLLVMAEFKPIIDYFEVGNWIRVRTDGKVYRLRLIEYEIDFDNLENINIQFSDVLSGAGGMSDVESILNQASSMSSSYGAVSRQAGKGSKSGERLDNWALKGLALTQMKIVDNAENQNITFDSLGLSCKEYLPITDDYDLKQLKLINRGIYLTDDGWLTSKVGIGDFQYYDPRTDKIVEDYGVIAKTLVGNLILSEEIGVFNTDGNILLDKNGLTITTNDGTLNESQPALTIQKKTVDANGIETISPVLSVDSGGNLVLQNYATSDSVTEAVNGMASAIDEAKRYATDYLTFDSSGLTVGYSDSTSKVNITSGSVSVGDPNGENVYTDSNGVYVRNGTTLLSQFKQSEAIIGRVANGIYNTQILSTGTNTGIHLRQNTTKLASFTNSGITLGQTSGVYTQVTTGGMTIGHGNTGTLASFTSSAATIGQTGGYHTILNTSGVSIKNNGVTLASFTGNEIILGQTSSYNTLLDLSGMTIRTGTTALAQFSGNGVNLNRSNGSYLGCLAYSSFYEGGSHIADEGLYIGGVNRVGIGAGSAGDRNSYKLVVDYDHITYRGGYSTAPWAMVTYSGNTTISSGGYSDLTSSGSLYSGTGWYGEFRYSTSSGVRVPYHGNVKVWASVYIDPNTDATPAQCGVYIYKNGSEVNSSYISSTGGGVVCAPKVVGVSDGDYFTISARCDSNATVYKGNISTFLMVEYM